MTGDSQSVPSSFKPRFTYLGAILISGAGVWLLVGTRTQMVVLGGDSTSSWTLSPIGVIAFVIGVAFILLARTGTAGRLAIAAGTSIVLGAMFVFSGGAILVAAGILLLIGIGIDVLIRPRTTEAGSGQALSQ